MSKKCIKCGQLLPDNASFCPHCTAIQNEKKKIKMPRRWKKKAFMVVAVLLLLLIVGAAVLIYHKPQDYKGSAQIIYPGKDKDYKVLLTFSQSDGMAGYAQGERTDVLAEGMDSALPCQLYVFDQETGELAWEKFMEEVDSCQVGSNPDENSWKVEYTEPVHNEGFPNAAYVSDIWFTSDSGTNDIVWTLRMKNGDTISLSTRLTIEKQASVSYFSEDIPMGNTEELKELLAFIEEEMPNGTPIYLHLPAVTYEGDITFGDYVWGIYGSAEEETVTTFTGTVNMKGLNGNYATFNGVHFQGDSGIGLNAYCLVSLSECSFDGWDIAAVAQNGAWVSVMDCTFTNNETALKLNSSFAYGTSPDYSYNTFIGNGTAVCIDDLPGNEVLVFAGSTFSGNEIDIDNKAGHPLDTANTIFE